MSQGCFVAHFQRLAWCQADDFRRTPPEARRRGARSAGPQRRTARGVKLPAVVPQGASLSARANAAFVGMAGPRIGYAVALARAF